ncbi:HAD-IA family hydrolase [Salinisphaera sp. T31B1]|uniref:HAD-IA family hydrolase n=1 Tax=Salinisphaera sp. T31B1 TaxID=727963 RepID=UPI00333FE431
MSELDYSQFRVLTFDVVGTLIDFEKGVLDSVRRLGGDAATGLSDDDIFGAYKRGRSANPGRSSQAMAQVYRELAGELGLPADDSRAESFQLDVIDWPAFSDSAQALARLRRNFRLVAMTNADRTAFTSYAEKLGWPFHDSVTFDETGTAKPDPQYFAYNRGRQYAFGYRFEEILHVAQSQYHDIGVARELGYTVCWIERRHGQKGFGGTPDPKQVTTPDAHFTTLAGLADAVEAGMATA